jgi:mono/diheme cytochrome c family protein
MSARLVQAFGVVGVAMVSGTLVLCGMNGSDASPEAVRVQVPENLETSPAVQAGAHLFQGNCVQCHGAPGIAAAVQGLNPAAPDLLLAGRRNDPAEVYLKIKNGIPGTAMPAWGDLLSDESVWSLAAFLHHSRGISVDAYDALAIAAATPDKGAADISK